MIDGLGVAVAVEVVPFRVIEGCGLLLRALGFSCTLDAYLQTLALFPSSKYRTPVTAIERARSASRSRRRPSRRSTEAPSTARAAILGCNLQVFSKLSLELHTGPNRHPDSRHSDEDV